MAEQLAKVVLSGSAVVKQTSSVRRRAIGSKAAKDLHGTLKQNDVKR